MAEDSTTIVDAAGSDVVSEVVNLHVVTEHDTMVVGVEAADTEVVEVVDESQVLLEHEDIVVVSESAQGPAGRPGVSTGGVVFIQDVSGIGGIVGQKQWRDTVPPMANIVSATSDTPNVRVLIGAAGGAKYSPTITVNGLAVPLTQSGTVRWFTGYVDLLLVEGENTITALSAEGFTDTVSILLAGPGPDVLSVSFGQYPGAQTELKAGDAVSVTITTEVDAVELTIVSSAANAQPVVLPVVGGEATGTLVVGAGSGSLPIVVRARNDLGTYGFDHTSTATLLINQTHPSITPIVVTYPAGLSAFGLGDVGGFSASVTNFDTVTYSSADLAIQDATTYAAYKPVTNTRTGYVGSGLNMSISATRAANNATTVRSGLALIATTAAKAAISIAGNPSRMVSSPVGQDYEVRVTPTQLLASAPSLDASLGSWVGAWSFTAGYWRRSLRVSDATPRGVGVFSNLLLIGLSGIVGTEITAGGTYVVGGMVVRNVTFPAFSRVAAIGASVSDPAKTSAQVSGGNVLVRQGDDSVVANGYYIANADGSYNPQGEYLGLSDLAFAGSNTSGSLVVTFSEVA